LEALNFKQDGALPSAFSVSDFAASSIGVAALAIAELVALQTASLPRVMIDRRLASAWFRWSLRPVGWALPQPWDPIAGDYRTQDGWIRLHTNAPHHRAAALQVLGVPADREAVTAAVAPWSAVALETAIIEAGGCAAEMRSIDAWTNHPQGRAVAEEKLAATTYRPAPAFTRWQPDPARPLAGLKILDLTRVLAGPIATRFLAGFGATVLRIDPPGWDEPGVVPEVTLGKRCARLDLTQPADRAILTSLLEQADILIHGYQPGALERLGFGKAERLAIAPHLSDVTLSAYGWSGPWAGRRGFDSLVQMSAGIADAGMRWKAADRPIPLPVQALDHATGYLMAAAAVRAVTTRLRGDGASTTKFSLARTAKALLDAGPASKETAFAEETEADLAPSIEETAWGQARRLTPPVQIDGVDLRWSRPATALGSAAPAWSGHD
jgi:crotonobetainyl-CoA:carnitine CoA-transferase CaiB-like acyl-CoA transferase